MAAPTHFPQQAAGATLVLSCPVMGGQALGDAFATNSLPFAFSMVCLG